MGRIINPETAGKERTQMLRALVLAMRELALQQDADNKTKDLAAFIALVLHNIHETIDLSVAAWEKRGYWIKADRFRMEWEWSQKLGNTMRLAVLQDDWAGVAITTAEIAKKVSSIKVPQRHRLGTPWDGAYTRLKQIS